jgi:hypothetical protein
VTGSYHRPVTDLRAAWDEIRDAKPDGWFVGHPTYVEHRRAWEQFAIDTKGAPEGWSPVARMDRRRRVRA